MSYEKYMFWKTNKKAHEIVIAIISLLLIIVLAFLISDAFNWRGDKKENSETNKRINNKPDDSAQNDGDKPENIIEGNKQAIEEARLASSAKIRPIDESDHYLGDLKAPVQLVVYSDFECPFCAAFSDTLKRAREEFGDKLVIAFRHFPLTNIHYNSLTAAIASECAGKQGKFWEMHDQLFKNNMEDKFYAEEFKKDAKEIGLNTAKFNECLDKEEYKDKVLGQMLEGRNAGITGTPGNFVDNEPVPGAYPLDDFTDSINEQREGLRNIINRHMDKKL